MHDYGFVVCMTMDLIERFIVFCFEMRVSVQYL